jgi:SnoaL-like protein
MKSDAFVNAVEGMDRAAVPDVLAEDIQFKSPVVFAPYQGREVVGLILTEGAMNVFEDFHYTHRFEEDDSAALIFEAKVGDRELQGMDLLRFDADGRVSELTVMVRPKSGVLALADAMAREFERVGLVPPKS